MAQDGTIVEIALRALSQLADRRGIDETTASVLRSRVSEEEASLPIEAIAQLILDRGYSRGLDSGSRPESVRAAALSELNWAEASYLEAGPEEAANARETYMKLLREFESS